MVLFIIILTISSVLFFFLYNYISLWFQTRQNELADGHQKLMDQIARLGAERQELGRELAELEKKLTFLKHDITPQATLAQGLDLPEDETSTDTRMADFMVTQGMITLEQLEKAQKAKEHLQMDFTAICHTLGFIDGKQAKSIKKQIK